MSQCLEVDSVVKYFKPEVDLLSDVSLMCRPGDVIGLFGRNGSGKSTLLKIIFGTLEAQHAFIRINGKILNKNAFLSGLVAYLPQHNYLLPELTVIETVKLCVASSRVNQFLGDKFLYKIRYSKVKHLSGGELRYLEIKLTLYSIADYILLDEPFNGLSPIAAEAIRDHIKEASKEKGIILSDHNFREVHKVTNRIYLLDQCVLKEIKDPLLLISYGYYEM